MPIDLMSCSGVWFDKLGWWETSPWHPKISRRTGASCPLATKLLFGMNLEYVYIFFVR